ncbi:hypothetical protein, partial [Bilophila wadsworthia]|uniref:hypothetical protein n=1 Tax=Bilophila wadsworthia TaxID=35833 RepID=UPI003A83ADE2
HDGKHPYCDFYNFIKIKQLSSKPSPFWIWQTICIYQSQDTPNSRHIMKSKKEKETLYGILN